MDTLLAARVQMGVSLAFHMVFAALGIGLPLLMVAAEGLALRTGRAHYRDLARTWSKATALTFVVGAVSGTALSFELGLLWPRFMEETGAVIGPAFALEGFAFFLEAIFLGLYIYGWERISKRAHWWTGVAVAVSGLLSGVLVVAANAYMQTPVAPKGDGMGAALAVFRAPSWAAMAIHSSLSCYIAAGFTVAAVYAAGLLRGRNDAYHRSGFAIALVVGGLAALLQPLSGDLSSRVAAVHQPAKLAAMEAHFETRSRAPLLLGGIPDERTGTVSLGLEIPAALSLLAFHDPDAIVVGLNDFPREDWPNVTLTHVAFQVMVAIGTGLVALTLALSVSRLRARRRAAPWVPGSGLLRAVVASGPLAFVALEAGWMVTELGRQPWIVYGIMRTGQGVTPVSEVPATLVVYVLLYAFLGVVLAGLLRSLGRSRRVDMRSGE